MNLRKICALLFLKMLNSLRVSFHLSCSLSCVHVKVKYVVNCHLFPEIFLPGLFFLQVYSLYTAAGMTAR